MCIKEDETSNHETLNQSVGGGRVPFAYRREEVLVDRTSNQSADGRREPLACENE